MPPQGAPILSTAEFIGRLAQTRFRVFAIEGVHVSEQKPRYRIHEFVWGSEYEHTLICYSCGFACL